MTANGALLGETVDGVAVFRGVPYAMPPFGTRRFLPPEPAQPWRGVRDARSFGPTAPKGPYPEPFDLLIPEVEIPGDDCLNLNVWTADPQASMPVMVWLHGGAFTNGSGAVASYDGTRFAQHGVVCVTVNYRLGVDGFLCLGGDDVTNLGLRDQIAALRWVRENIHAFGGDRDNVAVFGESAGAMSIGTLLAAPRAAGLFRRAVLQSGAAHHAITRTTAGKIGRRLADLLDVAPTREAIAAVPLDRLVAAVDVLRADIAVDPDPARWGEVADNAMPFEPVLDGDVLPAAPIESIRAGAGATVDILIGTNSDEFRLFLVPSGAVDVIDEPRLRAAAARYGLDPDKAVATYRAAHPGGSPGDLLAALTTDWYYRLPAIRLAEARAGQPGATYLYEFAWRPPTFNGRLGACHTLEIPFVFANPEDRSMASLVGPHPPRQLADLMHAAWVSFATKGNPGWPEYDPHRRTTMRFDTASRALDDPGSGQRTLWDGIR